MIADSALPHLGSAPAPGVVFRALAENSGRVNEFAALKSSLFLCGKFSGRHGFAGGSGLRSATAFVENSM